MHGIKRRSIGLFKSSSTLSLIQKISKDCEQASRVLKMCDEYEKAYCSQTGSYSDPNAFKTNASYQQANKDCPHSYSPAFNKGTNCFKFLWIRLALLNRLLMKIIEFIIANSNKYYLSYALAADPVDGPIFGSLIIGPCTLEYTRIKAYENFYSDPNADELIQRHRMHHAGLTVNTNSSNNLNASMSSSASQSSTSPKTRLGLNATYINKKIASANSSQALEDISNNATLLNSISEGPGKISAISPMSPVPNGGGLNSSSSAVKENIGFYSSPKEYVESLHQNSRSQIIYGKNHVTVNQVPF